MTKPAININLELISNAINSKKNQNRDFLQIIKERKYSLNITEDNLYEILDELLCAYKEIEHWRFSSEMDVVFPLIKE